MNNNDSHTPAGQNTSALTSPQPSASEVKAQYFLYRKANPLVTPRTPFALRMQSQGAPETDPER